MTLIFAGLAVLLTRQLNMPDGSEQHRAIQPSKPHGDTRPQKESPLKHRAERPPERAAQRKRAVNETAPSQAPKPPASGQSAERSASKGDDASESKAAAFQNEFARGNRDSPQIALTFDAGWEYKATLDMLDTLARHETHATFFLTGRWVSKNLELTRRIVAEGHEIGNHTYSHRRLTDLNAGEIAEEAEKTEQLVLETTGCTTKPLLRVPYGARNKRVLSVLEEHGYRSIYWDVDSWDGFKVGITPAEIEERVLGKVRNGSIVLMHCGSRATADALDSLLEKLIAAGYQPVTVRELLDNLRPPDPAQDDAPQAPISEKANSPVDNT